MLTDLDPRRKGKLTASRSACIMSGDLAKIDRLWKEMCGFAPEEYIGWKWPVRLGLWTEQLNLDWYGEANKVEVTRRRQFIIHRELPWVACTLDGWDAREQFDCPIEAKHVGGYEPSDVIRARYYCQCQHQMWVTRAQQCALSVIMGASEPIVEYIPADEMYIAELQFRGLKFMKHVWAKTPPVDLPTEPPKIQAIKEVDMNGNNQWADYAAIYKDTRDAYMKHEQVKKDLKGLVPEDVRKAFGHGVVVSRSRAGTLSVRRENE